MTTQVAPAQVAGEQETRPAATVLALARIEAVRLLRHPLVLASVLLSCWLLWRQARAELPVLYVLDVESQEALAPLAAMTMLAANLAALRSVRSGTEELYGSMRLSAVSRTLAHLVSVLPLVALAGLLVGAELAWLATDEYAAGAPSPAEVVTGPALVLFTGLLGVALARLAPFVAVAPVVLVVILMLHGALVGAGGLGAIAPLTLDINSIPAVSAAVNGRLAGWHLLYLLALAALAACVALVRAGDRRIAVSLGALALVGVVVGAGAQFVLAPTTDRGERRIEAAEQRLGHVCERRAAVTYCAYPNFAPRIELWDRTVSAIRRELPGAGPLRVNQRYIRPQWGMVGNVGQVPPQDPTAPVLVDAGWPRGENADYARLSLGIQVAQRALAVPELTYSDTEPACHSRASSALALWAAAHDPGTEAALRADVRVYTKANGGMLVLRSEYSSLMHQLWTAAEGQQALQLLDLPRADVRRLIAKHRSLLARDGTTLADVANAFGLPAPEQSGRGITEPCA